MYHIEKDVPIPSDLTDGNRKYPFKDMAVGDSVLFTDTPEGLHKAAAAARVYGHRVGKKFSRRSQSSDSIRIWRVK